jgi:hypothetical protein
VYIGVDMERGSRNTTMLEEERGMALFLLLSNVDLAAVSFFGIVGLVAKYRYHSFISKVTYSLTPACPLLWAL